MGLFHMRCFHYSLTAYCSNSVAACILQGGEPKYRKAWTQICDISRREFDKVYQRLGVTLEEKVSADYLYLVILVRDQILYCWYLACDTTFQLVVIG